VVAPGDVEDLAIPCCVAPGDEAIPVIREYPSRWMQAQPGLTNPAGG
jgi:hypothetical protein